MASQNINVGTNADDGTGESLRSAFIDIRKMFAEVYGQTYTSDTQDLGGATFDLYSKPDLTLVGNTLTLTKPDATTDTVDLSPYLDEDARAIASGTIDGAGIVTFTRDDATTFTLDLSSLLDDTNLITSVNTQTGAVVLDSDDIAEGSTNLYNATHTGDVTGSTALTIANDAVTHDKLAARYTSSESVTSASSITINTENADIFTWTAGHSATIDFTNVKIGDVVTLQVTGGGGSYTLTLQNINASAGTFNKIAGDYDDTSATKNLIEFKFISTSEAWYQISQIAS